MNASLSEHAPNGQADGVGVRGNLSWAADRGNLSWAAELGVPDHWLAHHAGTPVPAHLHLAVGVILTAIGALGTVGNAVVVWVFTRFRRLRSPANTFIVNLAASDLVTSLLHTMAAYSSFKHHWVFGRLGCSVYGGGVGLLGLVSIVTLSWIAVERLIVIRTSSTTSKWRITRQRARKLIFLIWLYCIALALPPFFGWSSYVPEGLLTSCSWDYIRRSGSNRAYYIYLLVGGFVLPVSTIIFCYSYILIALFQHSRLLITHTSTRSQSPRRNDLRTAQMVFTLILLFTISWSPYATISLIGQFGDLSLLTPWVTSLPALFAKASVIYNPIVYGMSHPHFRSSLQQLFSSVVLSQQPMHYKPSTAAAPRHVSVNSVFALRGGGGGDDEDDDEDDDDDSPSRRRRRRRRHWHSEENVPSPACPSGGELLLYGRPPPLSPDGANASEPDLLRHDDRVVPAHFVASAAYRREKRRFLRSALFCSESSLERYDRRVKAATTTTTTTTTTASTSSASRLRKASGGRAGGGCGLLPTTTPNCVLEQTGPGTWEHLALLAPSLPLHNDSSNVSVGSASPDPRRPSFATTCSRSPRLSLSKLNGTRVERHTNCCQCAAGDLAQTVTVATITNRRRSSTIHICLRGNLHQSMDV